MSKTSFGKAIDDAEEYVEDRVVLDTVSIGGRDVTLYEPTAGQAAYLTLAMASFSQGDSLEGMGQVINLIGNSMDDAGGRWFKKCLLDPRVELQPEDFVDLATILIEGTAANPTTEPSGSSPSRTATGRSSTAGSRRAASSRSGSRSTAS